MKLLLVAVLLVGCGKSEPKGKPDEPKPKADDPWAGETAAESKSDQPNAAAKPVEGPFLGRWNSSQAQWTGMSVADGSEKHEYQFAADGTYSYRREAYSVTRSDRYYVVRETGTIAVAGDRLTLTPTTTKASFRSRDGEVIESPELAAETTTYKVGLHTFQGINETQLVLTPIDGKPTNRDGSFASNDVFPTSYLLSNMSVLEWKFAD